MTQLILPPTPPSGAPTVQEWIEAMESDEYTYGAYALLYDDCYCALGVYADLCVKRGIGRWQRRPGADFVSLYQYVWESVTVEARLPKPWNILFVPVPDGARFIHSVNDNSPTGTYQEVIAALHSALTLPGWSDQ